MTIVRAFLSGAVAVLVAVFAVLATVPISPVNAAGQGASSGVAALGRGINILGYDGVWEGVWNAPFRLENFDAIRKAGFSHVRINFFGFKHMDADNVLDDAVLRRLDGVIEETLARKLIPVLDEHDTDLCQRNATECAVKLKAFWRQIASRYARKYPTLVFEILNEPGGNMTSAEWNALLGECLAIVRDSNPTRKVVVAILNTEELPVDRLALPAGDRNLIVTFHYYLPLQFTHQGAPWSPKFSKMAPLSWGSAQDEAKTSADFDKIRSWSEKEQRPVYLGEFGVYERAPADSRVKYLSFLTRSAERNGWSWAFWQFDHDFSAFDGARQRWKRDILNAIIPPVR
ncbi:glycoside hydrolase family 5 protein [Bradyrhizobium sp. USDA 4454]